MDMIVTKQILKEKAIDICRLCGLSSEPSKEGCDHCRMHITLANNNKVGNRFDVILNGDTGDIISITAS